MHVNGANLGAGVELRIEYFQGAQRVMIASCLKPLDEVKMIALEGLARFAADTARIVDRDGKVIAVVKR